LLSAPTNSGQTGYDHHRVNGDGFAHTVTAGVRGNPSGLFDSDTIEAGGSFRFTFQAPGTYTYFCRIHGGMEGVVIGEE
jgi:plastocyanin